MSKCPENALDLLISLGREVQELRDAADSGYALGLKYALDVCQHQTSADSCRAAIQTAILATGGKECFGCDGEGYRIVNDPIERMAVQVACGRCGGTGRQGCEQTEN